MRPSGLILAVAMATAAIFSAQAQSIQPHGGGSSGGQGFPSPSGAQIGPGSQAPSGGQPSGGGGQPGAPALQSGPAAGSEFWGAIAFTADGSYSTAWKQPTKAEAEAKVLRECARFGRGACEAVSGPGNLCIGLVAFRGGRYRLAWTAGGMTHPEAQRAAMTRCESDNRTQRHRNRCTLRISICGDGR